VNELEVAPDFKHCFKLFTLKPSDALGCNFTNLLVVSTQPKADVAVKRTLNEPDEEYVFVGLAVETADEPSPKFQLYDNVPEAIVLEFVNVNE
jgi:hypothetical protein